MWAPRSNHGGLPSADAQREQTQAPGSERQALETFLDSQREAVFRKIDGLDDATARKAPTASALSLLGIVKHCGLWERRWSRSSGRAEVPPRVVRGRRGRDGQDLMVDENDTVDQWVAYYREQIGIPRRRSVDGPRHPVRADGPDRGQRALRPVPP